ncbi:hypothetical protein NQZ68_006091 [Dissostichus eleginoides]|nr:hypothetical protein NQZ68_006091 [Dissostichus eleginoides]
MRDFLWFGTLRGEWITCLEVLDHSGAYSHTSTSIWCRSRSSEANDPSLPPLCSNGRVINMSNLRMDFKLCISRRGPNSQRDMQSHETCPRKTTTPDLQRLSVWASKSSREFPWAEHGMI